MHERSLAMDLLDIAGQELARYPRARVEAICLRIGPLSGVSRDAVRAAYEAAREQTLFASSLPSFEDIPMPRFAFRGHESGFRTETGAV